MRRISPTAFRIARRGTFREINRQIALNLVRANQPISRADLARLMGVRRGAITRLVDDLLGTGLVVEGAKGESKGGRKPMHLYIDTRHRCAMAVDIIREPHVRPDDGPAGPAAHGRHRVSDGGAA